MKIVMIYDSKKSGSAHSGIQHQAIRSAVELEKEINNNLNFLKIDISKKDFSNDWKNADILIFGDNNAYNFLGNAEKGYIEKMVLSGTIVVLNHNSSNKMNIFPRLNIGFNWHRGLPPQEITHVLSVGDAPKELVKGLKEIIEGKTISTLEPLPQEIKSEYVDKILIAKDEKGKEYNMAVFVHYPAKELQKPLGVLWLNFHCTYEDSKILRPLLQKIHLNLIQWWKHNGISLLRTRCFKLNESINL